MGYYTRFRVTTNTSAEPGVLDMLAEESGYGIEFLQGADTIKWYDQHEDCLAISKLVPDTTIRVEGSGEGDGDLWVSWYRDGKHVSYSPCIRLPASDEPPGGWDNEQLEPAKCWIGVQNSGRRWYFDTQAELDAEQARGGAFVRTFSMTEDFR